MPRSRQSRPAAPGQLDLDKVLSIEQLTRDLNQLLIQLVAQIGNDLVKITALVQAIPDAVLDISDLVDWVTCPLLPLAILEDGRAGQAAFAALDPNLQVQKLKDMLSAYVDSLSAIYFAGLEALNSYGLIKLMTGYIDQLKRIDLDADSFARSVTITATIAGLALSDAGCAQEYVQGPYADFAAAITDFTFTGLYPGGFDAVVTPVMDQLSQGEARLGAWRALIVTGL